MGLNYKSVYSSHQGEGDKNRERTLGKVMPKGWAEGGSEETEKQLAVSITKAKAEMCRSRWCREARYDRNDTSYWFSNKEVSDNVDKRHALE